MTKASTHTMTLQLLASIKIFNTFYVSRIRPSHSDDGIPGQSET
jgi:hypothetical protein